MTIARFQTVPGAAADLDVSAPKLHVVTFGCQMNKYDSLMVEGAFRKKGFATTGELAEADVVLFNTCSVRSHAEDRAWSWVGELAGAKRERPELVVGVIGCMAQRVGEEILRRAGHVDLVCGTRQIQKLPELVAELRERRRDPDRRSPRERTVVATGMDEDVLFEGAGDEYDGGLHGWLAVMRGCDLSCAFCIVPTTRGRVQSRPIPELVAEARRMVERGARAITLLGQTVNSYGEDFSAPAPGQLRSRGRQGRASLADLLYELQALDGLERLRLVTLHPAYATRALAEAVRDCDKVERFLPLPAQSGSDSVLRAMRRGYTRELYRRRVSSLRECVPDLELASDWIVGFPGETDADFESTLELCSEIGFAASYVFKYDPRPGTTAAERRADDVPLAVKKERNRLLLERAERAALARLSAHVGRTALVLAEAPSDRHPGSLTGRTQSGLPLRFEAPPSLLGTLCPVHVDHATPFGLTGSLTPQPTP